MRTRLLSLLVLIGCLWAAPPAEAIFAPVTGEVDDKRCAFSQRVGGAVCTVPSGTAISFRGEAPEFVSRTPVPKGTPIRLVTLAFQPLVNTSVGDFDRWKAQFTPRLDGTRLIAQVFHGGSWVTIDSSLFQARVFVELRETRTSFGLGNPFRVSANVRWVGRDGVGRALLKRCRFTAASRCRKASAYTRVVKSQRLGGRRGGRIAMRTRSALAFGRPLALVYKPRRSRAVKGDIVFLRGAPASQRFR